MKQKLQLSELNVQSFVTSSKKDGNTADLLGGSLPTDTDNPNICINYSVLVTCSVNTLQPTCIHSDNPLICVASTTPQCLVTRVALLCRSNLDPVC